MRHFFLQHKRKRTQSEQGDVKPFKGELLFLCGGEQEAERDRNRAGSRVIWGREGRSASIQSACGLPVKKRCKRRGKSQTHIDRVKMCTETRETSWPKWSRINTKHVHAWTDQRTMVQWQALISTPGGQEWVLHATAAFLSDSALSVELCCWALNKINK